MKRWLLIALPALSGCYRNTYYSKLPFHSVAISHQVAIAYVTIPCDDDNCGKKP